MPDTTKPTDPNMYVSPGAWAPVPADWQERSYFMSVDPDGRTFRAGPVRLSGRSTGNYGTLQELAAHPPADCHHTVYAVTLVRSAADPNVPAFAWAEVA